MENPLSTKLHYNMTRWRENSKNVPNPRPSLKYKMYMELRDKTHSISPAPHFTKHGSNKFYFEASTHSKNSTLSVLTNQSRPWTHDALNYHKS